MKIFKRCKECRGIVIFDYNGYCKWCFKREMLHEIRDITLYLLDLAIKKREEIIKNIEGFK